MGRLFRFFLFALLLAFCEVSFGASVKVLPLNAPSLPSEKLYTSITAQVLNAVWETGASVADNADYALLVTVLNPKGSIMVGAEVRGANSFYKKEAVNVGNVSMLEGGVRQVVHAVLKEIPADSSLNTELFAKADTVIKRDTVTRVDVVTRADTVKVVDTVVKVDTVRLVSTISRVDTVRILDTIVRGDANFPKTSNHYFMVGFSFAELFFLRERTERYKKATSSYRGYYENEYDIYDVEKTYTTEEQESSDQLCLGFALETPLAARLSRVFSFDLGINDSDFIFAFMGNLKYNLFETHALRKWNMFVQGGLGPVFAQIDTFGDDYESRNAVESIGSQIDESIHFGLAFGFNLGFDFDVGEKLKLQLGVKAEQVWLDFLDKLVGNRMLAITPYFAIGF